MARIYYVRQTVQRCPSCKSPVLKRSISEVLTTSLMKSQGQNQNSGKDFILFLKNKSVLQKSAAHKVYPCLDCQWWASDFYPLTTGSPNSLGQLFGKAWGYCERGGAFLAGHHVWLLDYAYLSVKEHRL